VTISPACGRRTSPIARGDRRACSAGPQISFQPPGFVSASQHS
jgi:hypothetical protein